MPTLLLYTLMTEPSPLQASPQTGNLTTTQLTIIAKNDTVAGVPLQGVIVQLPVGDGQNQLTNNAPGIVPLPPPGWTLAGTQPVTGAVQYIFQPTGGGTVASQQSLSFVFSDVEVNSTPGGPCEVVITEGSNDCQPSACPTVTIDLTKFPPGWGKVAFYAQPNMVSADGSTTLNWSGPGGKATYTIDYYTPAAGPVHVPEQGQPALSNQGQYPNPAAPLLQLAQTTTFYLTVVDRINDQRYEAKQQVTVTVEQPLPAIKSFTGLVEQVNGLDVLVLNWETTHTDHCLLTGDYNSLAPNSTNSSFKIYATHDAPLLPVYTLTAVNAVGQVTKQLRATAAAYVAQPISGFHSTYGVTDFCSLDNGRVLALVDSSIVEFAISGLTISVAKTAPTATSNPTALGFLPDGTRFYVKPATFGNDDTVQAFSATLEPIGMTPPISTVMAGVAATGGANPLLYVAYTYSGGYVSFFDTLTLQLVSYTWIVYPPANMIVAPAGDRLYVSCFGGSTFMSLDLPINSDSGNIEMTVGKSPQGIGVSQDGSRVVVACSHDNTVWVLDARTLSLIGAPIPVGNSPYGVAVAGHQAFVTNEGSGTISIIDIMATPPVTVGAPIPVAGTPKAITVTKDGLWLLVALDSGMTAMVWQKKHYQAADSSA